MNKKGKIYSLHLSESQLEAILQALNYKLTFSTYKGRFTRAAQNTVRSRINDIKKAR